MRAELDSDCEAQWNYFSSFNIIRVLYAPVWAGGPSSLRSKRTTSKINWFFIEYICRICTHTNLYATRKSSTHIQKEKHSANVKTVKNVFFCVCLCVWCFVTFFLCWTWKSSWVFLCAREYFRLLLLFACVHNIW